MDTLEAQEPGRRHLSGFYVQRGRNVLAGGRLRLRIVLVRGVWRPFLSGRAMRPAAAASNSPSALPPPLPPPSRHALPPLSLPPAPQATEIVKAASNIRNTRFHIQSPYMGSVEHKTLQDMEAQGESA